MRRPKSLAFNQALNRVLISNKLELGDIQNLTSNSRRRETSIIELLNHVKNLRKLIRTRVTGFFGDAQSRKNAILGVLR